MTALQMRQDASTGQLVAVETPGSEQSVVETKTPDVLEVKVWSPFQIFYQGQATSVSGVNGTGAFDILARHRNFITLLDACDLALQTKDGQIKIKIAGGVMHVRKNAVTVFLEV